MNKVARLVDFEKDPIREWEKELTELMEKEKGIGIAGPQGGINVQIAIVKNSPNNILLLNPRIIQKLHGNYKNKEGCLSIPGDIYKVSRYTGIVLENHTRNGTMYTMSTSNKKLSACLQHEIDHLNGICIKNKGKKHGV